MKKIFLFIWISLITQLAFALAPEFQGFVELANKQKIYAIHYKAPEGQPTVILLNGLTYTTQAWSKMTEKLVGQNFGVIIYDARGMGKTLEETGPATDVIAIQTQVEDLAQMMNHFQLSEADLCGLSYGGALGLNFALKYPERVRNLILLAPYVKPLKQQDDMLKQKVKMHRLTNPWDKRSDDEIYDHYLRQMIHQTYPIYEPVLNEHPWRTEAAFRMVQGVRKYIAKDSAAQLPSEKIHFVVAGKDQYVPTADHEEFWNAMSSAQKVSRLNVTGAEHKMPESIPNFTAAWVREIVLGNGKISSGRVFTGDPKTGVVKSSDEAFVIDRN